MEKTLLIMAGGMGSRFGGLKQITPVGPNGEFLIDYAIYDAIKAGFTKVVFVIKRENEEIFRETIGSRVEGKIKTEYAFQDLMDLPEGYSLPKGRSKPWGTGHAILSARKYITGPFVVMNADDFYGRDAFLAASSFLEQVDDRNYGAVLYQATHTLTEHGSVKRGICEVNDHYLVSITESTIEKVNGQVLACPLMGGDFSPVSEDTLVSMNLFCFSSSIFSVLEGGFSSFLEENQDDFTSEYLIPDVIQKLIQEKQVQVSIIKTNAKWYGVTYQKDKEEVEKAILKMHEDAIYPPQLWIKP